MIRFHNCKILTKDMIIAEGNELWVKGNKIEYIGKPKEGVFEREIDCKGNVLMPGFKNAHTHSSMTFLRSYADDLPLDRWLNEMVFPMEARLTDEDAYYMSKLAVAEFVSGGITSAFDMYLYPNAIAEAARSTGFRMTICGAVNNFTSSPKELEANYDKYNSYCENVSFQLGFHAEYTTDIGILREISDIAGKYKAPVSAHCSETGLEREECIKRHGKSPVELFDSLGLIDYGGSLFHCVHLSQRDIDILKERDITVVTNPASNCKLASGIAPLSRLDERGIRIAIGTDGPASNNALSMFREMYLATALQKLQTKNASALVPKKVLEMACVNGAYAMGTNNDCLAEGKDADITVIDMHKPNMQPVNNIIENIVYSGGNENIALTMVNGKILYEKGEFYIGEDIELLYKKCRDITQRIKKAQ